MDMIIALSSFWQHWPYLFLNSNIYTLLEKQEMRRNKDMAYLKASFMMEELLWWLLVARMMTVLVMEWFVRWFPRFVWSFSL
jgi:hypothetical protein